MAIELHTGMVPGRLVWGNPARETIKKDQQTKQIVLRDGQPVKQWAFGVAFPRAHFEQVIWPALAQEAASAFPNGVPPRFAWKYTDGDGIDSKGQPFANREGYAGHIVLTISTEAFAPPIFKRNAQGTYDQVHPEGIKTGDYVALGLVIKFNGATGTNTPGLYVNPQAIELVGYGTEIHSVGAVDPNALFGGMQYQLPAGASATPMVQPGATAMPGMGMQPQPGMGMQPQPGQLPTPAHDFVQNAGMQPQMGGMPGVGQMPGR